MSDTSVTRRDFLRTGVIAGAAMLIPARLSFGEEVAKKPKVWVYTGTDKTKLMEACLKTISENGGFGKDVKKMTLKVNAAWARTPEQAANTHPDLVAAFITGVKKTGVTEVIVPELACSAWDANWEKNGIKAAVEKAGGKMVNLAQNANLFKVVNIPKGVKLKTAKVASYFTETDCLVNMPIAKNHGATRTTIALKNWMGAIQDRGFWHSNDLHQCMVDFATFLQPKWTIVDATRVLLTEGPAGLGQVKEPNQLILSQDQVAADAYASTLIVDKTVKLRYLTLATAAKLGESDIAKMDVIKIDVK